VNGAHEPRLNRACTRGENPQRAFRLSPQKLPKVVGLIDHGREATHRAGDELCAVAIGGLDRSREGRLGQRPQNLPEKVIAVAGPAKQGRAVYAELGSQLLHLDAAPGHEPSPGKAERI